MDTDELKTIIFWANSPEDIVKSIAFLSEVIKEREDTHHKLFFSPLMLNTYKLGMGEIGDDGKPHFTGNNEVIFMPKVDETIQRMIELKHVRYSKNCMSFVGESEAKMKKTNDIIDWLLEKVEEIKL